MNYLLFLLIGMTFGTKTPAIHNVEMAIFHISESRDDINIKISFDLEDISSSLDKSPKSIDINTIQVYLDKYFSIELNSDASKLLVLQTEIIKDHLIIKGACKKKSSKINSIKLNNTCLIEFEKHSNIIQLELNNTTKDFRMHKERTSIEVQY